MPLKVKKRTLADKINALITAAPSNFASDDEAEDTTAKVVENYEEDDSDDNLRQSKIRRLNTETLDQIDNRYAGKKVSRKDVFDDNSNSEGSEEDSDEKEDDGDIESTNGESEENDEDIGEQDGYSSGNEDENIAEESNEDEPNEDESNEGESNEDEESDEDEDDYGFDIGNPLYRDRSNTAQIKTMSDTNVKAEVEKGNCVRTQLKLWESLLEMRIKLQKCLITSNQMPQCDVHKDYRADTEFMKKTNESKDKLTLLLNNLLQLQSSLWKQYPETKNLDSQNMKRKSNASGDDEENEDDPMDEEIPSDTEDEAENENEDKDEEESTAQKPSGKERNEAPKKKLKLSEYGKILEENHKKYIDYRNSVIQKWNEKTRIATGSLNKGMSQTTLKQIEFALSDKPKLYKRTQLKRSEYKIVGKAEAPQDNDGQRVQEYDTEIYDDDDFYHQLLRDLIEYKSSDVTDPIQLSKQWIQLQNMRRKMKRKVDTKATKGRKIRYNVHNKLVNFMAPITVNDTWTDLAKNELYNSLFGKIKPADDVTR